MKTTTILAAGLLLSTINGFAQKALIQEQFALAEKQAKVMLADIPAATPTNTKPLPVSPRTLTPAGALQLVPARDWTSGFFPGELWYLYEFTGDKQWMEQARTYTAKLEGEKTNAGTHDMGFKIYCSFGNGYRLTNDPAYREVIIQSAKTLIKRFKPAAGIIRSWDHHKEVWQCPVIIDNMMNLELLFAATKLTGDKTFADIAVKHAQTTMKNHFRPDMSSYHVIDYDTLTGKILKRNTHQGYSHESAWARGQAWALYGYTMCYRETKDKAFLTQADAIANFMLTHPRMPKDLIPYWDFDAPQIPNEPRDVSAATVMASALYELSTFSGQGKLYRAKADQIIANLAKGYVSPVGASHGFVLLHSTGSKPSNTEVDQPLSYADYYYLEALLRKKQLEK